MADTYSRQAPDPLVRIPASVPMDVWLALASPGAQALRANFFTADFAASINVGLRQRFWKENALPGEEVSGG